MAIIFGVLHFSNPEMDRSVVWVGLNYVFSGFMLTLIAIKMGQSELSVGMHAANNMFLSWFITDAGSVNGDIPSLFEVNNINPFFSLIWSICVFTYFYIMSLRKFKGNRKKNPIVLCRIYQLIIFSSNYSLCVRINIFTYLLSLFIIVIFTRFFIGE